MTLRSVTFADLDPTTAYALWRLRQQVFVVEQASPYPDLDGRDLEPTTRHFLLEEEGELVGCARLLDDGDALRVGRVVVAPAFRGRGLADLLMRAVMAEIGDRPARLDAQTGLADWYASFGFEVTGPAFDDAGVLHLPMERPVEEGVASTRR
ncbi:MAG: GNAT family N-acetyltransferase [Nocardioidaceae bacterium]